MRSCAPALLPVFRSRLQADILAAALLNADREYSLPDLARRFNAPLTTVHGAEAPAQRALGIWSRCQMMRTERAAAGAALAVAAGWVSPNAHYWPARDREARAADVSWS